MLRYLLFVFLSSCAVNPGSTKIMKSDIQGFSPVYAYSSSGSFLS